jgi:hypothetical protein
VSYARDDGGYKARGTLVTLADGGRLFEASRKIKRNRALGYKTKDTTILEGTSRMSSAMDIYTGRYFSSSY